MIHWIREICKWNSSLSQMQMIYALIPDSQGIPRGTLFSFCTISRIWDTVGQTLLSVPVTGQEWDQNLPPCPSALGMSVDTSFAAVDHLTSSAETCDLITPVHLQESQGLCAHGNETEMGLKIPVCPGLSNTQCLSDIGLHSGNPVDPCGTFMGVEAFSLDSWICLRTQTHILFFSNW